MLKVKTIALDGNKTTVNFPDGYPYYFIKNLGDSEIYVSRAPDISPEADGVYTVSAGEETRIGEGYRFDKFYIIGTGKVQVRGEQTALPVSSFKAGQKGGDGGGVGLESKIVDALPETGESSFLYLVPKNDLLTDNIYDEYLWVGGNWEKIGSTELSVNTDYNELENKPSIGGVELDGNKTLAELGISTSSFDGEYSSLSGKPVVYTNNNYNAEVFKGWYRMCEIHNVTDSFAGILILEFVPGGGYTQNIICAVGWTNSAGPFCKIISSSGQVDMVTQIRFSYRDKNPNWPLYIDIYKSYSTSAIANVTLLCNPKSSLQERNITLAPISGSTVPTGYDSKTFAITETKIPTVDTALSDTSTNAVQNKVITNALNEKLVSAKTHAEKLITDLVGNAPDALNTIYELAEAIQDNKEIVEALNSAINKKQDILFQTTTLYDNNTDWNTLTTAAVYSISINSGFSDDNTHGLQDVYSYGVLVILARPNVSTDAIYHIYINDRKEVYVRSCYQSIWRTWSRIDAGRVATDTIIGGIKSVGDITVASDGSVNVVGNYTNVSLGGKSLFSTSDKQKFVKLYSQPWGAVPKGSISLFMYGMNLISTGVIHLTNGGGFGAVQYHLNDSNYSPTIFILKKAWDMPTEIWARLNNIYGDNVDENVEFTICTCDPEYCTPITRVYDTLPTEYLYATELTTRGPWTFIDLNTVYSPTAST